MIENTFYKKESEDETIRRKPEFESGAFTIEYLSASSKGFEAITRESLLRHPVGASLPEADKIKTERDKEPKKWRVGPDFVPLVGVRNVKQEGNLLSFDIKPVTFPTYKAISSPQETREAIEVSNPTATALILLTTEADGSRRLVV